MRIVIQCCLLCLNLQFHGWWKGITFHPSCDFAVWIKCNRIKDSVPQNHGKKKVFALSCFRWLHANANKSSTTSVVRFTNKWLFWAESLRVLSHLPHLVRLNRTRVLCPSWCGLFGQMWMQQSHLGVHQKRTKRPDCKRTLERFARGEKAIRAKEPSCIIIHDGKYVIKSCSQCLILWVRIFVIAIENRRAPLHIKMLWN